MNKLSTLISITFLLLVSVQAEIIKDIRIVNQLGESYDISSVEAYTTFKVGEAVSDRETILSSIAVDVDRMRSSDRFSFVHAQMEVEEDGIVLIYTVTSKYRLRRIEMVGGKKSGQKIKQKSELEVGQFADDSTFELAASKIKAAYRDFWYPDVKVKWESRTDAELGVVDVVFHVDEGPKMGIKNIVFEGNDLIEDKKLESLIQQKRKRWYSFITGAGKYKEEVVDSDVFAIKSFYMNNGFLDVKVFEPVLNESTPKKSKLTFKIEEGQRYRIGDISISGMEVFTEEELRRGIRVRRGDIASYERIEAGAESVRAYCGNRGHVRSQIRSIYHADSGRGIVDITYEVSEGPVGFINRVNISGNERTIDKVIRRELVMHPGEKYNRSRIKTSEARLRNLNYFEYATISAEPSGKTDHYDLNVQVKEKPTGQFSAGIGFSSVDALVGYVELSQGNFDWKRWPPVGGGQKFKIRAQLGTQRNDIEISFVEPWFMDRKLSLGVDLYHQEARYFSDAYDQKTDGMRLSLGKPLSRFTRGSLAYTLEQFDVFDVSSTASTAIKEEEGRRLKSSLAYTWTFDSRDRYFNATRGNKTTISPYFSGGSLGAETDVYGMRIRSIHHWPLPLLDGVVLNARAQAESIEAFSESKKNAGTFGDGVPIFDRFFLGGPRTLRGFEYRDVGPFDPTSPDDPVGGNSSAQATAELTYPLWDKIRGAVFYDWGFVNPDSWNFDSELYHDNWGIGLRFDLPGFPLHLDYAWPITYDEEYLSGKARFNFQIGHTF
ncbi:MAG TPA: outer membrane protein assembly factor BamA [Pontiella sp.]